MLGKDKLICNSLCLECLIVSVYSSWGDIELGNSGGARGTT